MMMKVRRMIMRMRRTTTKMIRCCDVAVAQINYPILNKQDSIEQVRGRSHEESLIQIFML
jgi:hypothetical protein